MRLSNGNGYVNGTNIGQESIQNGHSSDQHSDDEYIDTVEVRLIDVKCPSLSLCMVRTINDDVKF